MNKIVMRAGILLISTTIFLTGCSSAINFASNTSIGKGSGKGEVVSHGIKSFEADQFNSIEVQTEAMNITITQGDQNEASVELRTDDSIKNEFTYDASIQGKVLEVTVNEREKSMKDSSGERTLLITLPKNEELELNITNAFGSITLDNIAIGEAKLELNAGNINTNKVTGDIDATVNAGEIDIRNATGGYSIQTHVDAGNVKIEFDEAPQQARFDLRTEVGEVKLSVDDVNYSVQKKNEIQGKRGSDGSLVQADVNVGNIKVSVK